MDYRTLSLSSMSQCCAGLMSEPNYCHCQEFCRFCSQKITTGVPADSSPSLIGGEVEPVPFPLPRTCVQFVLITWALGGRVKDCKCGRTRGRASTQPQGSCRSCWVQAFPCGHFEADSWRSPLTPFSVSTVSKLIGFPRWTLVKSYLSLLLGRDFSNS